MLICARPGSDHAHERSVGGDLLQLCLCLLVWRQQQIELGWRLNLGIVISWFRPVKWRFLARLRSAGTLIRPIKTEINHNSCWDQDGCWRGAVFLLGMTLPAGGWLHVWRRPGPLLQRRGRSAASGISKGHNELFTFSPQREPAR